VLEIPCGMLVEYTVFDQHIHLSMPFVPHIGHPQIGQGTAFYALAVEKVDFEAVADKPFDLRLGFQDGFQRTDMGILRAVGYHQVVPIVFEFVFPKDVDVIVRNGAVGKS